MHFANFDLEYTQSIWEQRVDINLTESGVHPIRLDELLDGDADKLAELMSNSAISFLERSQQGPPTSR